MKIYLVGGAVRDGLLGRAVQDKDYVVVGASSEDMRKLGYQQVGKDFPVFLHPESRSEYALARTERKSGKGYKGFEVFAAPDVTIDQDLKRRDITINAIAQDENGALIDPCGGVNDLKNKIIRHVTEAFAEDPLRVLRVARFHARFTSLGFTIAKETLNLMQKITDSGELEDLVPERVWVEVNKALGESTPSQFFLTLRECGALKVLFPEIENLYGVPQRKEHHPEVDTGIHTMLVLEQAARLSANTEIRFAALMHDLGKADTPQDVLPRHIGHEKRTLKHINNICKRYKIPKSYQRLALLVAEHHGIMHRIFELRPSTVLNLFEKLDAFRNPERLQKFVLSCKADALGRLGRENENYPQADYAIKLFDASKEVKAQVFVDQGLKGSEIAEAVRQERIKVIKNMQT